MDAVTPTRIKPDDLTRGELLRLVLEVAPFVTQRQLWRVRWNEAVAKSDEAGKRALEAADRRTAAAEKHTVTKPGTAANDRSWREYMHARNQYDSVQRASDRAFTAEQRAYRAYSATLEA